MYKPFTNLTINELFDIYKARVDVFVVEQNCPYPEIDDIDKEAMHVTIYQNNQLKAYCRVFRKDEDTIQIGRVLSTQRNNHYGYDVMKEGIEVAKREFNAKQIYIEAQVYAIPFYEKPACRYRVFRNSVTLLSIRAATSVPSAFTNFSPMMFS